MLNYIIRRILLMIPTLLGITFVVFLVMAKSPGGIGGSLLNELGELDSQQARMIREYYENRYGLDQPFFIQYLNWLNRVSPIGFNIVDNPDGSQSHGSFSFKFPDLGESLAKRRPVTTLYAEALPVTLTLNLITTPIIYVLAIVLGVYAGRHRGSFYDVTVGVTMLALWSLPTIMVGVLMIGFLANRDFLQWFPTSGLSSMDAPNMSFLPRTTDAGFQPGWLLDRAWHLALPVICLLYGSFAFLMKLERASLLENVNADFVRTARAKGVDERTVLWRHAFRNSLLPLITVAASILPGLLAGSVIIEHIFSLPGMGALMVESIFARDREVVMAGALVSGLLGLVCILVADIGYAIADPRVSYE